MEDQEDSARPVRAEGQESTNSSRGAQAAVRYPSSEEEGILLFQEAMSSAQRQDWESAMEALEQALKLYETRQDDRWVARVRATLAGIYAEQNRIYKSKELYAQALSEFRKIGDTRSAHVILARLAELESSPGVKVVQVRKGGIAERAGIAAGDVIMEYAGETGFRLVGFKKLVEDYSGGDQVTLSFMRNGEITTTVVSGGFLGVEVEDIKRPPRPQRPPEPRPRERQRPRGRGARR
jgi:C-terminal processing protease CtpA/Prc